jgi:hypothetical protein
MKNALQQPLNLNHPCLGVVTIMPVLVVLASASSLWWSLWSHPLSTKVAPACIIIVETIAAIVRIVTRASTTTRKKLIHQ